MTGLISDQAPPGHDYLLRRLAELERQVRELAAARRLEAATIGAGGLTIRDGAVYVLDSGGHLVAQLGRLPDGTYGLAALNAGDIVALSTIAFGPRAASDPTEGTRSSSTFGDLTGTNPGPSVPVTIGPTGRALVFWAAQFGFTGEWETHATAGISVEVSGATAIPPSGDYTLGHQLELLTPAPPNNTQFSFVFQGGMMHFFDNLSPGTNTFTLKYRNVEGTNNVRFLTREIAVFPF